MTQTSLAVSKLGLLTLGTLDRRRTNARFPFCGLTEEELPGSRIELNGVLRERGLVHLRNSTSGDCLSTTVLQIASLLGKPTPGRRGQLTETLTPIHPDNANPNSLSRQHGVRAFPAHTDGAHRLCPPHYIILACVNPGSTDVPTLLIDFRTLPLDDTDRGLCKSATFLVRNGRNSFYSSILDETRLFVRFDRECMTPVFSDGMEISKSVSRHVAKHIPMAFHWREGDILIIDNWRFLHGRGLATSVASSDRCILRVSVT
jgi:alpha-ketoglutarate-dependent taurine dioxygenase